MRGTMMDYPLTLSHLIERAGKLFPKVEIVSRLADKSLHRCTYGDIERRAQALCSALLDAGLNPGDRVATLMWNHYAHLEAYFGVPGAGGVFHTLNLRLAPDDLAYIVNHAQDRFLVIDDVLLPLYEQFRDKVNLERVFVVRISDAPVPDGFEAYEDFIAAGPDGDAWPLLGEYDAAGMCYTSGTTGRPKGVVYTHRALVLHTFAISLVDSLGISLRETILPVVPMFHVNSWGLPFACAMVGARLVFPGPYLDAENLLDLFARERVSMAAGVPTIWLGVVQALEAGPDKWDLVPGMRLMTGGAAPPESLLRAAERLGLKAMHGWGMTEMTPVGTVASFKPHMSELSEDERYAHLAKQGLPLPFVDVRVIGEDGQAPWDGKTMGELQVRGPWIASSYHEQPDAQDRWTEDGWFATGDVATIDPEGYVQITDRTKDLVKSGGEWISSVDLENALMGHAAVAEAAVIAVAHPKWQERPLAVVKVKDGAEATPDALRDHLAVKFANWWLPDAFVFVDEILRTSTGKFLKTALRERFKDWNWDAA